MINRFIRSQVPIIAMLVAMLITSTAMANDIVMVGVGGTMRRMQGEHPGIQMVREWVRVDVYPEHYKVTAQFVFHNAGEETTVKMGFPEGSYDLAQDNQEPYKKHSAFKNFRTTVDGQPVPAKRIFQSEEDRYEAFWIKTVRFRANQTRIVRVLYESPAGEASYGSRAAEYNFTGGNWAGKQERGYYLVVMHLSGTNMVWIPGGDVVRRENRFSSSWKDWSAEKNTLVLYSPLPQGGMLLHADEEMENFVEIEFNMFDTDEAHIVVQPGKSLGNLGYTGVRLVKEIVYIDMPLLKAILDAYGLLGAQNGVHHAYFNDDLKIVSTDEKRNIRFSADSTTAEMEDGKKIELPAKPIKTEDSVLIPLLPIAELFDFDVNIDKITHQVHLKKKCFFWMPRVVEHNSGYRQWKSLPQKDSCLSLRETDQ